MVENARHKLVEQCLRAVIAVFIVALVMGAYPYTSDPTTHIKQVLTAYFAAAMGLGWLFSVFVFGLPVRRPRIAIEMLFCLLGFMALSTFMMSEYLEISLVELSIFLPLFVIYLVGTQVFYRLEHVQFLIQWICVAVAIGSLYAFLQKFGGDPFPWADKGSDVYTNLPAMYGNPNFAAHVLILALIFSGYMVSVGHRGYLAMMALFVTHLYYTDQRAGLVALTAAIVLLGVAFFFNRFPGTKAVRRVALTLIVTAVLGVLGLGGIMLLNLVRTGHPFPLDLSLLIRYQSYVSASNMILDHPLLGHGPGVYKVSYAQYWTPFEQEWFAQENRMNAHVHNDLMELAIDAGLPAAGLYMALLLTGMFFALLLAFASEEHARRRFGYALAMFFMAFAVDGLFGFNLRVPVSAALFFLILGVLDALWSDQPVSLPEALPKKSLMLIAGVLLAIAMLATVYLQTNVFRSEYYLLEGMSAFEVANTASSQNQPEQYASYMASARSHLEKGEILAPWNWVFALRLGQVASQEGKFLESIDHYERSLKRNPYYIMTHLAAAQSHLLLAQKQLDSMPTVSVAQPTEDDASSKINLISPVEMLEEGRAHAEAIEKLCPMFPRAQSTLGRISSLTALTLMKSEEKVPEDTVKKFWEDSEKQYERAIAYGVPNLADLYRLLARVRLSLGKDAMAEDALVRAVQVDPLDSVTWNLFFDFAQSAKRFDRMRDTAKALAGKLAEDEVKNATAIAHTQVWLAKILETGFHDFEGADNAYREALRHQPLDAGLWSQVGDYALKSKRFESLQDFIKESCLRLETDENRKALDHVAALNTLILRGDSALNEVTQILLAMHRAHQPNSPLNPAQAYGWAASYCYLRMKTSPLPLQELCDTHLNLGIMFTGFRDFPTADDLFATGDTCFTAAQKATAAIYKADSYLSRDRATDAITILQQAQILDPANLEVRWTYARVLTKTGDVTGARSAYESLLNETDLDDNAKAKVKAEHDALPK